jgi:hypothetical protein
MTNLVTNEFSAQPGRGEDVANLLIELLMGLDQAPRWRQG